MNVLQVCFKLPYPPNDGGAYSIYSTGISLLQTNEVQLKVFAMSQLKNGDDPNSIPPSYAEQTQLEYYTIDNRVKLLAAFRNLFSSRSYFVDRFYSKEFEQNLLEIIRSNNFDIIQLEHSFLGIYENAIRSIFNGKIILRAQNVEHQLWGSYISSLTSVSPKKWYLKQMTKRLTYFERRLANSLDGVICLTKNDQHSFQSFNPKVRTTIVPIGFDKQEYTIQPVQDTDGTIYHIGSMDWLPNLQGIEWFLKDIFPTICERNPDLIFRLAGKRMPASLKQLQNRNIINDGEVPNSINYQKDRSILIVPLLSGGGMRVKIIEALALGKVIITTSKGAEGINYKNGEHLFIADTPEEFILKIEACLNSLEIRQKLSSNARQLFESEYTLDVCGQKMISFYRSILDS